MDIRQIVGTERYHTLICIHLTYVATTQPVKIQIVGILKHHTGNGEGVLYRLLQEFIQRRGSLVFLTLVI